MAANANVLPGSTDKEKLDALCARTFKGQAVWFLNSFWETFAEAEAENLWNYVHKAQEIDVDNKVWIFCFLFWFWSFLSRLYFCFLVVVVVFLSLSLSVRFVSFRFSCMYCHFCL